MRVPEVPALPKLHRRPACHFVVDDVGYEFSIFVTISVSIIVLGRVVTVVDVLLYILGLPYFFLHRFVDSAMNLTLT